MHEIIWLIIVTGKIQSLYSFWFFVQNEQIKKKSKIPSDRSLEKVPKSFTPMSGGLNSQISPKNNFHN